MNARMIRRMGMGVVAAACILSADAILAQLPSGEPVNYPKKLTLTVSNPLDIARPGEPVVISLAEIFRQVPDFNRNFFRVKRSANEGFEPLDIPSQIRLVPVAGYGKELVFQVDLAPGERKTVEILYNPKEAAPIGYPARTAAFGKWYTGGGNIAWESDVAAYRSYGGVVDYFGKSYQHLRLRDLPADSYHHEAVWGVDPFMIGSKPGLCGVALADDGMLVPCYGGRDSLSYVHNAFGGGPVCAGAVVTVQKPGETILHEVYTLYAGRHENQIRVIPTRKRELLAVGVQRNDGEMTKLDERSGYFVSWAPAGGYGTIAHILVFDPARYAGTEDVLDGHFIKLKPGSDGTVTYMSAGAWYRVSAEQPGSPDALLQYAERLARGFLNPVRVQFEQ